LDNHTPEEWESYLGKQIREARVKKKLRQEDLALAAEISLPTISRLEAGKGSSLYTFIKVLQMLEMEDALLAVRFDVRTSTSRRRGMGSGGVGLGLGGIGGMGGMGGSAKRLASGSGFGDVGLLGPKERNAANPEGAPWSESDVYHVPIPIPLYPDEVYELVRRIKDGPYYALPTPAPRRVRKSTQSDDGVYHLSEYDESDL
jgi:DNA-binding XRE family transcriptional regulator